MRLFDEPASWEVSERRDVHRGYAIGVHVDRLRQPGSDATFHRDVVDHVGAVGVLAVNERDEVLLVRQYRHPAQHVLVEIPAGLCDTEGEPPLETARRELVEEGQVRARRWTPLVSTYTTPGTSNERIEVFLAEDIVLDQADQDFAYEHEEAEMERGWVALNDVVEAVLAGRISNGMLVTAVMTYAVARQRRQAPLR